MAKLPETTGNLAPRLQTMQAVADQYGLEILLATLNTPISPALVLALIGAQAGDGLQRPGQPQTIGVMHLPPDIAAEFGGDGTQTTAENIKAGVSYLVWLLEKYDGDPILALSGYYAGTDAIEEYSGVPPLPQSRIFVPKVLAAFQVARSLCMTPPVLFSDGCVFALKEKN